MLARNFYTTKQIAELCGVHITTAIRWFDAGELQGYRTPGGRRRIAAAELKNFVDRHKIPLRRPLPSDRHVVLIVDDDQQVIKSATKHLGSPRGRYQVESASSAYDALILAASVQPNLVVLDIGMKGVDGLELIAALRRHPATQKIPVLAIASKYSPDVRKKAIAAGASDCRSKEDALSELSTIVDEALGGAAHT